MDTQTLISLGEEKWLPKKTEKEQPVTGGEVRRYGILELPDRGRKQIC